MSFLDKASSTEVSFFEAPVVIECSNRFIGFQKIYPCNSDEIGCMAGKLTETIVSPLGILVAAI